MDFLWNFDVVSFEESLLRLVLALCFGIILGLERDAKDKPIDFRAYMIICVTTCMLAIMGQELYEDYSGANNVVSVDLAKIISGVLTGIGFLGAGAIIKRSNDDVVGTATGASVWASGAIGLSLGFGMYGLAIIVFLLIAATLFTGKILLRKTEEAAE